jgi:hypothetical protein
VGECAEHRFYDFKYQFQPISHSFRKIKSSLNSIGIEIKKFKSKKFLIIENNISMN